MTMQCKFETIEVQFHFCIDSAVKRNESIQNKDEVNSKESDFQLQRNVDIHQMHWQVLTDSCTFGFYAIPCDMGAAIDSETE
jgi:hypothetical protein